MKRGGAGITKKRVSPATGSLRRHVKIEVDDQKENVKLADSARRPPTDVKGKGNATPKEDVDFDALLDGMDWDEGPAPATSQDKKRTIAVRDSDST